MFYGGYLVYSERLPYKVVFTVAEVKPTIEAWKVPSVSCAQALLLGTMMVGQATAFAPNYGKAMIAAARAFNLLDRSQSYKHPSSL